MCSLVICGKPLHVWHLSLLKEHNILKLLGMVLSYLLGIYGNFKGIDVGSTLWLILFLSNVSALLIASSKFPNNLLNVTLSRFLGRDRYCFIDTLNNVKNISWFVLFSNFSKEAKY